MFGDKKKIKDSERSLISETVSIEGTINSSGAIDIAGLIKGPVMDYLKAATPEMLIPASLVAMVAAYIMGSSGKYAGMTSALVAIFGPNYLVWFLCTEYSGYLISPAHKCLMIGQQYFGTPIKKYYAVLSRLCAILIGYAALTTFVF